MMVTCTWLNSSSVAEFAFFGLRAPFATARTADPSSAIRCTMTSASPSFVFFSTSAPMRASGDAMDASVPLDGRIDGLQLAV